MQQGIGNEVHIGELVKPFKSVEKSAAIDKTASDFDNVSLKVKKNRRLIEKGIYDADIAHYTPRTLDLFFQGMIERVKLIEQLEDTTYKDKEALDFELIVGKNLNTNLKSLHICFPVKFKKLSNVAQDLDANLYLVNIFLPIE